MNNSIFFFKQRILDCAIQFVSKFALACGQIRRDLNRETLPRICTSRVDASMPVSQQVFMKFIVLIITCSTGLVIDGSIAYPFNDGTKALLEVLPEDALLTMKMID